MEQNSSKQTSRYLQLKRQLQEKIKKIMGRISSQQQNAHSPLSQFYEIFYNQFYQQIQYSFTKLYPHQLRSHQISTSNLFQLFIEQCKQVSFFIWKLILNSQQQTDYYINKQQSKKNVTICHICQQLLDWNRIRATKAQICSSSFFDPYHLYLHVDRQGQEQNQQQLKLQLNKTQINDKIFTLKQRISQRIDDINKLLNKLTKYTDINYIFSNQTNKNKQQNASINIQCYLKNVIDVIEKKFIQMIKKFKISKEHPNKVQKQIGLQVGKTHQQLQKINQQNDKNAKKKQKQIEDLKITLQNAEENISKICQQLEKTKSNNQEHSKQQHQIQIQLNNQKQVNKKIVRRLSQKQKQLQGLEEQIAIIKLKHQKQKQQLIELNSQQKKQLIKQYKKKSKVRKAGRNNSINVALNKFSLTHDELSSIDIDEQSSTLLTLDQEKLGLSQLNTDNYELSEPTNTIAANIKDKMKNEKDPQQKKIAKTQNKSQMIKIVQYLSPTSQKQDQKESQRQEIQKTKYQRLQTNMLTNNNQNLQSKNLSTQPTFRLTHKFNQDKNTNSPISKALPKYKLQRVSAPILQAFSKKSHYIIKSQLYPDSRKQSQKSQQSTQYREFQDQQDHMKNVESHHQFSSLTSKKVSRCQAKYSQISITPNQSQTKRKNTQSLISQLSNPKPSPVLPLTSILNTLDIQQSLVQFPMIFDRQDVINLYLSIEGSISYEKEKKRIINTSGTLKPNQLKCINTVLSIMSTLHPQYPTSYQSIRALLLNPYQSIISQQNYIIISKPKHTQLKIKDALIRIILIHRICKNDQKTCIHLRKFISKIQQLFYLKKQIPMPIISQQKQSKGKDN